MKIISLNIYGGTIFEPLLEFIKKESADTDIFCFQEVFRSDSDVISNGARMNIFTDLAKALPDFDAYFTPTFERFDLTGRVEFAVVGGEAMYVRKSIPIINHGNVFVYGTYNDVVIHDEGKLEFPAALQYIHIEHNSQPLLVSHIHGIVWPGTKIDSPARLEQSRNIVEFLNKQPGEKILCGDFNLMPDTESVRLIEKSGMRNLIKEFKIADTRGTLNAKKNPGNPQYFADYCFVSPGITVRNFTVLDLPISDHLPLVLEF